MSNFDIINWVKELKIKNVDGVFKTDRRQWASDCGIIKEKVHEPPESALLIGENSKSMN